MPSFALAALVIALIASAGAVPILRGLFKAAGDPPPVGGLAILIGIAVASFYMDPWPAAAIGLVVGAVLLVAVGIVVDRRGLLSDNEAMRRRVERIGTVAAGLFLFAFLDQSRVTWSFGFWLLFIAALCLPLATSALDRIRHGTAALPAGIVLIEILLLLLFGAVNAPAGNRFVLYQEYVVVALPAVGGLIGCLIYLSRMPWRPEAAISIGVGGKLALGLLTAWGALRLGAITAEVRGGTTALLWLIAVPTFELIRSHLGYRAGLIGASPRLSGPRWNWLGRILVAIPTSGYSPVALAIIALLAGGVGIAMCAFGVSGYWMTLALGVFFALYLAIPAAGAVASARNDRVTPVARPLVSSGARD